MSTSPIRIEDRNEAAKYDIRATLADDPEEARNLRWLADLLRRPVSHWPIEDAKRQSYDEYHQVTDELGDLHATRPDEDTFVRLPVRVAMHGGDGLIQVGPYDLRAKDISVLRRAIESYDRLNASIVYGPPLTREQLLAMEAEPDA